MADFAIVVVSQGIQLCSIAATYVDSLKDRDEDITSIDRQAQSLWSIFRALKESLAQGSLDPSTSSAVAQALSSMQICETELCRLKQLVARFSDKLSPDARPRDKIKQQVKKLKYPIQKPAISRIQRSLRAVKETLDLALQNLELSYSLLTANKLSTLEKASQQASNSFAALGSDVTTLGNLMSTVQEQIPTIQDSLDSIPSLFNKKADRQLDQIQEFHWHWVQSNDALNDSVDGLHIKLDGLLECLRQDDMTMATAINKVNPKTSIYKLAPKPSSFAGPCASLENHSENGIPTINVFQKAPRVNMSPCPCRRQLIHSTKRISWLSWDFWDNEILRLEHSKGCKYFRSDGDERSRIRGLRFTNFSGNALIVTLYTSTGAGGQSLGSNLEYQATVDRKTSPAFRVISVLEECANMLFTQDVRQAKHQAQWKRLSLIANQKLESLFRMGRARAKDIDSSNQSLLHAVAKVSYNIRYLSFFPDDIEEAYSSPIAQLAGFLIKNQISASLRDLNGNQAFIIAIGHEPTSILLAEAFHPLNADIYDIRRSKCRQFLRSQDLARSLKCYATIPRVAEVIHGPLSVAVLSNDQTETYRLLRKYPKCLEEREYRYGRTPFHLALGNPECLRTIVERCNLRLLVQTDASNYTVLGYAIVLSEALCDRQKDQDESSCRCTLPLRILLEAGCPIIPYRDLRGKFFGEATIAHASQHCKVHLAKSLLQRRQRLKSIAQQYLSPTEIDKFGLHRLVPPDINAMQIDEILRDRGYLEFGPLATYLEDDIVGHSPVQDNRSIYHELSTAEDANIYFGLGFHDITVRLDKLDRWMPSNYGVCFHMSLPFVKWLLDHDAPLCEWVQHWSPPWTGYVADAFILAILGGEGSRNRCARKGDEALAHELEERMLLDDSLDSCHCRCSPGGCTPFVARMKHMKLCGSEFDIATTFTAYLKEHGNTLKMEHYYAAIRFVTFNALGITHTCICRERFRPGPELDAEEIAEIQDEYAELLELLESLIEEFETHAFEAFNAATDGLDSIVAFWSGYWVRRMSQILSELSQAGEETKSAAEGLGVIWGPQVEREIDEVSAPKWKGWNYYFQTIKGIE